MQKVRIIIIGGGFAGLYLANALGRKFRKTAVEITLISENDYFLFSPLLPSFIVGHLEVNHILENIEDVLPSNVKFKNEEVKSINRENKEVYTNTNKYQYDKLVIASGSKPKLLGVPGVAEFAYVIKDIGSAKRLRKRILELVMGNGFRGNVVIVGAGPTGVELAADISDVLRLGKNIDNIKVYLIESGNIILPKFKSYARSYATKNLQKKKVEMIFNSQVVSMDSGKVHLSNGESIESLATIWVAGVEPNTIEINPPIRLHTNNRVLINEYLETVDDKDILAIGDVADIDPVYNYSFPATAQSAIKQANFLASSLYRKITGKKLEKFHYNEMGLLVGLGKWNAAGHIKRVPVYGVAAWAMWQTVYLMKFFSWKRRAEVVRSWHKGWVRKHSLYTKET